MKTQTPCSNPRRGCSWKPTAVFALATGALLVLSSCHHGVLGQPRRPHPHVAVYHRHAPDQFAPAYYGTRGTSGKAVASQPKCRSCCPSGRYFAHHHTTWGDLHRQPNYRHCLGF